MYDFWYMHMASIFSLLRRSWFDEHLPEQMLDIVLS